MAEAHPSHQQMITITKNYIMALIFLFKILEISLLTTNWTGATSFYDTPYAYFVSTA
jgi:hypothetical protein